MSEERAIRINKVLRELNISLDRAIDFLKGKGFDIEATPNAKITDQEYSVLCKQFSPEKGEKVVNIEVAEEKKAKKETLKIEREQEIIRAKAKEIASLKPIEKIDLTPKKMQGTLSADLTYRVIKLSTVLDELQLPPNLAIDFLQKKGFEVNSRPESKITFEQRKLLHEVFGKPKDIQILEKKLKLTLPFVRSINSNDNTYNNNYFILDFDNNVIAIDLNIIITNKQTLSTKGKNKGKNVYEILRTFPKLETLKLYFVTQKNIDNFLELNFISTYKNLQKLVIVNGKIKDITFITDVTTLEILNLEQNEIEDITLMGELTNLKKLKLNDNRIYNLNALEKLKSLSHLDLSSNNITELNIFKKFKRIIYLNISNNGISDVSDLKFSQFSELILNKNKIFDITPLYNSILKNEINSISLIDNPIYYPPLEIVEKDIESIKYWIKKSLEITNKKIESFRKSNSKTLDLSMCGLTDLSFIPQLFVDTEKLEELILSNDYAILDDNGEWNNQKQNGFYPNNISNVSNDFVKLKNLKKLIIGGDWNLRDHWNNWRIKDVSFLLKLDKLEVINISNNQIEYLPKLNKLHNLTILVASNNLISQIEPLGSFKSLHELYLSNNKIDDIAFLKDLSSIKTIDLHSNKIKDLKPIIPLVRERNLKIDYTKWKVDTINIFNNPLDETLINILKSSDKDSKEQELINYFDRLIQGDSLTVKKVKLILLGNTQAGKTTLADILANSNKANGNSTHGINFFRFQINDIEVNGYDFGGQDYYHSTHYSFFDEKSLYLLIWGNKQENSLSCNNKEEILFPINYWVGSLKKYANESSIKLFIEELRYNKILYNDDYIQTLSNTFTSTNNEEFTKLFDLTSNIEKLKELFNLSTKEAKKILNELDDYDNNKIVTNTKYRDNINIDLANLTESISNIPLQRGNNFSFQTFLIQNINTEDTKRFLNEYDLKKSYPFISDFRSYNFKNEKIELRKFVEHISKSFVRETRVLKIDNDISKNFITKKDKVILTIEDVRKLNKNLTNYGNEQINSLLNGLHGILACFYFKLNDDLKTKLSLESLQDIVIINLEKFTDWIYQILNQEVFLKEKEGYFSKEEALSWLKEDIAKDKIDYILAFMLQNKLIFKMQESNLFFSPNYLSDKQSQAEKLFLDSFESPLIKYEFNEYFHMSILSEIINEYFDKLLLEDNKKQYVLWKNKLLLYENNNSNQLVYVSFELNVESPSITISKYNKSVSDTFILDLAEFIEKTIIGYNYVKMVKSNYNNYIPYNLLNTTTKTEEDFKSNFVIYKERTYKRSDFKMFLNNKNDYPMKKVCISYSKEDLSLVNKFRDYLVPLSDDGLIEDPWCCTDLIAGEKWDDVIKQKFHEADIIFFMISENLMKTKYVKEVEIKGAIDRWNENKSVKIIPIILEYYHWSREGSYDLSQFTALPYMAKPVTDFINQKMGWYIVVDAIRHMIKNNPDEATFRKDVLKIFERIVEGKVDNNNH